MQDGYICILSRHAVYVTVLILADLKYRRESCIVIYSCGVRCQTLYQKLKAIVKLLSSSSEIHELCKSIQQQSKASYTTRVFVRSFSCTLSVVSNDGELNCSMFLLSINHTLLLDV